jgi:hypothetical protein
MGFDKLFNIISTIRIVISTGTDDTELDSILLPFCDADPLCVCTSPCFTVSRTCNEHPVWLVTKSCLLCFMHRQNHKDIVSLHLCPTVLVVANAACALIVFILYLLLLTCVHLCSIVVMLTHAQLAVMINCATVVRSHCVSFHYVTSKADKQCLPIGQLD